MSELGDLAAGLFASVLRPVAGAAAVVATAWALGAWLLGPDDGGGLGGAARAAALGLGLVATGVLALAAGGLLLPPAVGALLAVANLAALPAWRRAVAARPRRAAAALLPGRAAAAAVAVGAVFLGVLALYPTIGFDPTLYHLPYVHAFLATGRLEALAGSRFPVFPQLNEMLFAAAVALGGEGAAAPLELAMAGLAAALAFAWARRVASPRAGAWAAALWLGSPLVVWLATQAYVDAALGLFALASVEPLCRGAAPGDAGATRRLALAGAGAGFAAGVKYLGLFFVAVPALALAVAALRRRRAAPWIAFTAAALLAAAPWYARVAAFRGDPLDPFLARRPAPAAAAAAAEPLVPGAVDGSRDAVVRELRLPRTLVSAVFRPHRLEPRPPLSPWWLLALPIGGVAAWRVRPLRPAVALTFGYVATWALLPPDVRFLTPALAVGAAPLAVGLDRLLPRPATARRRWWLAAAGTALLLAPGLAYGGRMLGRYGALPLRPEARRRWTWARVPGSEALARLAERTGERASVYLLAAENLRDFVPGQALGDRSGAARYALVTPLLEHPGALRRRLLRLGADHLLVLRRDEGFTRTPGFRRRFAPVVETPEARIYRVRGPTEATDRPWR